jgi:hypothetical protein
MKRYTSKSNPMNYSLNRYDLPALIKNNVRIDWVNIGEGNDGDYDPTDKYDENLLRFDVSHLVNNEWEPVDDGSYCTQMPATCGNDLLKVGLETIMNSIYDDVSSHGRAKRICEQMSWISPHDLVGA